MDKIVSSVMEKSWANVDIEVLSTGSGVERVQQMEWKVSTLAKREIADTREENPTFRITNLRILRQEQRVF